MLVRIINYLVYTLIPIVISIAYAYALINGKDLKMFPEPTYSLMLLAAIISALANLSFFVQGILVNIMGEKVYKSMRETLFMGILVIPPYLPIKAISMVESFLIIILLSLIFLI